MIGLKKKFLAQMVSVKSMSCVEKIQNDIFGHVVSDAEITDLFATISTYLINKLGLKSIKKNVIKLYENILHINGNGDECFFYRKMIVNIDFMLQTGASLYNCFEHVYFDDNNKVNPSKEDLEKMVDIVNEQLD